MSLWKFAKLLRPASCEKSKESTLADGRGIDLTFGGAVGYTKFEVTMLVTRFSILVKKRATSNQLRVTSIQQLILKQNQLSLTTHKVQGTLKCGIE